MKLSRRKFLNLGATTAIALGAPPCIIGCDGASSSTPSGKSTMAAVKGNDLTTMTREVFIPSRTHLGTIAARPLPYSQASAGSVSLLSSGTMKRLRLPTIHPASFVSFT